MDFTNRDKVLLLVGASIGVIVIGIALESVQTYASIQQNKAIDEFLRSTPNGRTADALAIDRNGRPSTIPAASVARTASTSTDVLEFAYSDNGIS
jgi:hypothetical protein